MYSIDILKLQSLVLKQKLCIFSLFFKKKEEKRSPVMKSEENWAVCQSEQFSILTLCFSLGACANPLNLCLLMCKRERDGGTVFEDFQFQNTIIIGD